jgi:hypothetical protein
LGEHLVAILLATEKTISIATLFATEKIFSIAIQLATTKHSLSCNLACN